jgi:hypothetical protein
MLTDLIFSQLLLVGIVNLLCAEPLIRQGAVSPISISPFMLLPSP